MLIGANVGMAGWGLGIVRAPADGVGGATPQSEPANLSEQDFRDLSADEGLDRLQIAPVDVNPDLNEMAVSEFPGPIAEAFYWDDSLIVAIQGPVGSGKTTTLLKSRLRRAKMMPRSVIDGVRRYTLLVIRETYRQLWSTTIPDVLGVFPKEMGDWVGGRGAPVIFTMNFEDEDGPIEFTMLMMAFGDDIVAALRGFKVTDAWLHEMDTNNEDVLANAITRIKRAPDQIHFEGYPAELRDYGQIVGDLNAPEKDNYCFNLFHDPEKKKEVLRRINADLPEGSAPIEINFYRQPGYGEPGCENLQNLPPNYYPGQIAGLTLQGQGHLVDRLVRNKVVWTRIGDPVFRREFNRTIHVSAEPLDLIPDLPLRIGLDQGFLGAAVIAQYNPPGRWRIYRTLFFPKDRLLAKEFGRRLGEFLEEEFPGHPIEGGWGDMAGEHGSSIAADENETWNLLVGQTAGFFIMPQTIGTNRIQPRLEAVRAPLELMRGGEPGLLIDPSCEPLISGFEARYVWADEIDASGDRRKVPNKKIAEANVMDALQYLLLSEGLANGLAPESITSNRSAMGHNQGPPLGDMGGLQTGFDVLDPYNGV